MFFRQSRKHKKSIAESGDDSQPSSVIEERERSLDLIRPCFIICNSNAMFYQQMVHLSHTFYLKMFLDKGINVFTWNYRNYGRSKGKPTPENLKKDVAEVYNFIRNKLKLQGKIGIYGRSLGGIPSSYLSNQVDMAIIDRSFCNLAAMARWKYNGIFADYLFKIGSCGWQAQNDFHIVSKATLPQSGDAENPGKERRCYKLIT